MCLKRSAHGARNAVPGLFSLCCAHGLFRRLPVNAPNSSSLIKSDRGTAQGVLRHNLVTSSSMWNVTLGQQERDIAWGRGEEALLICGGDATLHRILGYRPSHGLPCTWVVQGKGRPSTPVLAFYGATVSVKRAQVAFHSHRWAGYSSAFFWQ